MKIIGLSLPIEDKIKLEKKITEHQLEKSKYDPRIKKHGSTYSAKADIEGMEKLYNEKDFVSSAI